MYRNIKKKKNCCSFEGEARVNARTRRTYLTNFWREKCVLTDNTMSFFRNEIWKFKSLLLGGRQFWVGSHVVVRLDGDIDNDDHEWTWKARIEDFFVYECECILEVFFLARYFDQ